MNTNYRKYTNKELLDDDYFVQSMIHPTNESDEFWNSLVSEEIIDFDEFVQARDFIQLMKRPGKIITGRERNDIWVKIEIANKKNLRKNIKKKKLYLYGSVASLFIVLSSLSLFFINNTKDNTINFHELMSDSEKSQESEDIQLILTDKTIELKEKSVDIELNKKGEILVNSQQMAEAPIVEVKKKEEPYNFNKLIVPMGRHSRLVLPDGTRMHVNAGSTVMFPNKFKNNEREIFVNGEVYLDVARNDKSPFYVRTENMDIRVLGTCLNVRAYQQDNSHTVVLVSGSVSVHTKDNYDAQLSPDQILGYSKGKCSIAAVNAQNYISWIYGYFIYDKEPLTHIMQQISRYYGVKIEYHDNISYITCSGKLDLKEDLTKVMADLSNVLPVAIQRNGESYNITELN